MLKNISRPAKFQLMNEFFLKGAEAILFDLEGTLVSFQWNLEGAVRDTLETLTGLGFQVERLRGKKYSILMIEAMKIAPEYGQSPEEVRTKIGAIYDRYDEDAFTRWDLRPGAREFLYGLKKKGIKCGLVTNVGSKVLRKGLLKLDIDHFFEVVVSRNDVQAPKPSGEGMMLALDRLQVKRDNAFYVGDSLDDIHAAKEAGMKVMIMMGGDSPKEDLLSAKPDFWVNDFGELIAFLRKGAP